MPSLPRNLKRVTPLLSTCNVKLSDGAEEVTSLSSLPHCCEKDGFPLHGHISDATTDDTVVALEGGNGRLVRASHCAAAHTESSGMIGEPGKWLPGVCRDAQRSIQSALGLQRKTSDQSDDGPAISILARSAQDAVLLAQLHDKEPRPLAVRRAILANLASSLVMLSVKTLAVMETRSITLLMSCFSAFLSISACLVLFLAATLARTQSKRDFPGGRARFEPLALVIFSTFLIASALQGGTLAVRQLALGSSSAPPPLHTYKRPETSTFLIIFSCLVFLQTINLLYMGNRAVSSACLRALVKDSFMDLLQNYFVMSIAWMGYAPAISRWWVDPAGSIVVCGSIAMVWFSTVRRQIRFLSGFRAKSRRYAELQDCTINILRDQGQLRALRAYHVGSRLFVECDISFASDLTFGDVVALIGTLETALNQYDDVERAFVRIHPKASDSNYSRSDESAGSRHRSTSGVPSKKKEMEAAEYRLEAGTDEEIGASFFCEASEDSRTCGSITAAFHHPIAPKTAGF